ncbi:DUF4835 family protein [Flavobacterium agricola]|uniref:DUF4835 family protein n=1 Tax=Flavobacterium agricola TaxID=2870839 RepID=A0ABY6M0V9_9FLAO|nr:DUF4835 family protein [Flavobacterium agricola]UYW02156.1 DUF4835 family protein [Flavobacterium agricola]
MRKIYTVVLLLLAQWGNAQELKCNVQVNYNQITNANPQVFRTLQTQLTDFMNNTKWTNRIYTPVELIDCSMYITVNSYDNNILNSTIQIQSSRPGYNSTYSSPVLNMHDRDFTFDYIENQQLNFNKDLYSSELASTLAFYAYVIIGLDADTFALNGGESSLKTAQNIVNVAQSSGRSGWIQGDNRQNRYYFITDLMAPNFEAFRKSLFGYHLHGIDAMADNTKKGKEQIKKAVLDLNALHGSRPNSYLMRVFFDAKATEIVDVFSGGPEIATSDLKETLSRISPQNSAKWNQIK